MAENEGEDEDEEIMPEAPHWALRPQGAVPAVAIGAWVALHAAAGTLLLVHGSLQAAGRVGVGLYAGSTSLAGLLYAALVLSDPGYVDEAAIRAQLAALRLRSATCETSTLLQPEAGRDLEWRAPAEALADADAAGAGTAAPASDVATDAELAALFSGHCAVCRIPRPVRSRHCRHCGRCVWRYDHHCFLLSNCVGEANHALFWWFLLAQAVSVWCTIPLVLRAMEDDPSFAAWLLHTGPLFACNLLLWPAGVFITLLLVLHTAMALVDTTSYESAKHHTLEYMQDVPECAHPFADVLPCVSLARFCARSRGTLVPRPPPFRTWRGTCWRNRYYSCC